MVAVRPTREIASPPGSLITGHLGQMRRDPLKLLSDAARDHGHIVRLRFGPQTFLLLSHPDDVRRVLLDNAANYPKSVLFDRLKVLVGEGLLTSQGDFWKRQRRIAQPSFQRDKLAAFAEPIATATGEMLSDWRGHASDGKSFDIATEMMRLTFTIVGRALFGLDLAKEAVELGPTINAAMRQTYERIHSLVPLPMFVPTPSNLALRRRIEELDALVYELIGARRRDPQQRGDFLSMLLAAQDEETGERMTDRQLRDEILTMVLAGHETTACLLSWTLYLLALHGPIEQRLADEVRTVVGDRLPMAEDVARLPYTAMVVQEGLRLYPPAWLFSRRAKERDEIRGFEIAPGTQIYVSPYVTQRHPAFWDDPELFDPERFAPDNIEARPRFSYFPFGGGQRQCIGKHFAMIESTIILAMIVRAYRIELVPGAPVQAEPGLTLHPRSIRAMVTARG